MELINSGDFLPGFFTDGFVGFSLPLRETEQAGIQNEVNFAHACLLIYIPAVGQIQNQPTWTSD
jgi:hypothetical protein